MIIRCIDFETTGFPPNAGVCEVGWTDVTIANGEIFIGDSFGLLCNPNMPIEEKAGSVHGITDAMVANEPPTAQRFMTVMDGAEVFCAHNAEFEQAFFGGGEKDWICTYKVALVLYPDLPTHKNGDLPGHLGIDLDPSRCEPLHRAAPDTYVTAMNLVHMLEQLSPAQMIEITTRSREISRMPFGLHKGKPLSEVPDDYICWAIENMSAADVRAALAREAKRRKAVAA